MARTVPRVRSHGFGVGVAIAASLITIAVSIVILGSREPPARVEAAGFPPSQAVPVSVHRLRPIVGGGAIGWHLPVPFAGPRDVEVSADGTAWITEQDKGAVDALRDGQLIRYEVDAKFPGSGAFALSPGPSGSLWFTGYPNGNIGRLLPDGTVNSFSAIADPSATVAAVQALDGAMWITDVNLGELIKIDGSGRVAAYPVPPPSGVPGGVGPYDIARTSDGTIWFTDPRTRAIGRVSDPGGTPTIAEYRIGDGSVPRSIAAGPDGTAWVTLPKARSIGSVDADGTVHAIHVDSRAAIQDVAVADDGTLWLTTAGRYLLHVRPNGTTIDRIEMPGGAVGADGIAVAGDGAVWAAATDHDMVVEIPARSAG